MFQYSSLVYNKAALDQVVVWCRTANKILPEPMMTKLTHAYMSSGFVMLNHWLHLHV